jgi:hypothetical protein
MRLQKVAAAIIGQRGLQLQRLLLLLLLLLATTRTATGLALNFSLFSLFSQLCFPLFAQIQNCPRHSLGIVGILIAQRR